MNEGMYEMNCSCDSIDRSSSTKILDLLFRFDINDDDRIARSCDP